MGKHFFVNILIALVLMCFKNRTSEAEMDQVEFLWKEQNWQKMTWFTKVYSHKGLLDKRNLSDFKDTYEPVTKLKIITLLMGCGYGQKLTDYLWLTTYTVTACRDLSEGTSNSDCWERLEKYLKKGEHGLKKLLLAFKQITSLDGRLNRNDIPFPDTLSTIKMFLSENVSKVKNGLTKVEAIWFNLQIVSFAKSLGDIVDFFCVPKHSIVEQRELTNEYNNLTDEYKKRYKINDLYDFYEYELDTAIETITEHMIYIGFNYIPEKQIMTYDVPPSSAAAYD